MQRPITLASEDYIQDLINITNEAPLPTFVKIDILNSFVRNLEPLARQEYEREKAMFAEAEAKAKAKEKLKAEAEKEDE